MSDQLITLTVANHPGVLSQVSGLFARRNYNLDGVFVTGLTGTTESCMQLLVTHDERLPQVIKQLEKLYDVKAIEVSDDIPGMFQEELRQVAF